MSKSLKGKTNNNYSSNNVKESKVAYQMLEQEKNMLKITLDYVVKQNDSLKQQCEDMKMTVKHNKELLKEYVEKITNKDKVVEKMNSTIDQLTGRIQSLEEYIKQINKKSEKTERNEKPPLPNMKRKTGDNNISSAYLKSEGKQGSRSSSSAPRNILSSENLNITNAPQTKSVGNTATTNITGNNISTSNLTRNTTQLTRNNSDLLPSNPKKDKDSVSVSSTILPSAKTLNRQSDEKVKEFFLMQSRILEEMNTLKDDLQFILENKKKSKLAETLQKSFRSLNNSVMSDASSINLNNSIISDRSATNQPHQKKYNLKEKFNFDANMKKFQDFLISYNPSKNILLFVDSKNNFWELIKRNDLNMTVLNNNSENIISATSGMFTNKFLIDHADDDSPKSKLFNIEIKDYSLNNSELDISKVTDYNFLRDLNEN